MFLHTDRCVSWGQLLTSLSLSFSHCKVPVRLKETVPVKPLAQRLVVAISVSSPQGSSIVSHSVAPQASQALGWVCGQASHNFSAGIQRLWEWVQGSRAGWEVLLIQMGEGGEEGTGNLQVPTHPSPFSFGVI